MLRRKAKAEPGPFLAARPVVSQGEPGPLSGFFFYAVLLALGGAGALGCFFTAFALTPDPLPMALLGFACVLFCAMQQLLGRRKWLAALLGLLVWVFLGWNHYDLLVQGSIRTVNVVFAAYSQRLNTTLPTFALPPGAVYERQRSITFFAVYLQFPFYWFLSWALQRRGSAAGAFCVTGLLLLLPLGFSILPAAWALGLLFTFWGFLLLAAPSLHRFSDVPGEEGRLHLSAPNFLRWETLALLPILALALALGYRLYPPETYVRPQAAVEARERINSATDLPALFSGEGGGSANRVNLASLGSRKYTGETVLRTRHQWPDGRPGTSGALNSQKDYLKSFVGSVYTGQSWERLSSPQTEAAERALGHYHAQTLPTTLTAALPDSASVYPYTVSVEKIHADVRSVFAPAGLSAPRGLPDSIAFEDDGYLQSSHWFRGPSSYTLEAQAQPAFGQHLLSRYTMSYADFLGLSYRGRTLGDDGPYTALMTVLMADYNDSIEITDPNSMDRYPLPDWALDAYAGEDRAALEALRDYTAFVYETYTQLPEDTLAFAQGYAEQNGLSQPSAYQRDQYAKQVRDLLWAQCVYDLSPPSPGDGDDFVEYFLSQSHRGYCVHFATAAVALLRAAGIPARYAEGYAVPVDSAEGWVDVPDYNAHAWVEIYWSGTGWLPFEVTPPNPDAPAAYRNAVAPSPGEIPREPARPTPTPLPEPTPQAPVDFGPTPTRAPTPTPAAAAAVTGRRSPWLDMLLALLELLAPFVLLSVLIWLQRLPRLWLRRRRFSQPDRNKAALAVYAHILKLYRENNRCMTNHFEVPDVATQLALKARFGGRPVTAEELEKLRSIAAVMEKRLDQGLTEWERRRCRYLLALF